ncbi:plasmid mobilization protein [Rhizobium terrae]|uniref:plasmid mobilization protein n=1 Tax=Rhizobium terrae TaxID=2171756 RepID=UPI000E3D7B75|nr:hypothetical protein [Rhizobium terrae]
MAKAFQEPQRARRAGQARSRIVNVRFSPSEMEAVISAADQAGLTISQFMRSLSLEGAGVEPFLNEDDRVIFAYLREELRRIGINLNGLLRLAHRGILEEPEIVEQLGELRLGLAGLGIETGRLAPRASIRRRRAV